MSLNRLSILAVSTALSFALLQACRPAGGDEDVRLLARVHNKSLYLSDLEGMIPEGSSSEDSSLIIRAFTERWVRDAVMLHEAERNVPKDLNIDKLVRDYRASLVQHTYEKVLVDQLLDSTVTQAELDAFYEINKEEYYLNHHVLRFRFVKIPLVPSNLQQFEKWWVGDSQEDLLELRNYCASYAVHSVLDDNLWMRASEVAHLFPEGIISETQLLYQGSLKRQDETFRYYFRKLDARPEGEIAPQSYVADQIRKVILHKRKMSLLYETKENMYERALRLNEVKIYIQ
jgi:hypothetical protein